jgi:hypothetical protein
MYFIAMWECHVFSEKNEGTRCTKSNKIKFKYLFLVNLHIDLEKKLFLLYFMKKKYYIQLEISKDRMVGAQVNPNYLENWLLTLRADLTSHKKILAISEWAQLYIPF